MPTFFNPAANLTANRVPYALGGGRLGDSQCSFDSATGQLRFGSTTYGLAAIASGGSVGSGIGVYDGATLRSVIRNSGSYAVVADTGGWARAFQARSNDNLSVLGHFGYDGTADVLSHIFLSTDGSSTTAGLNVKGNVALLGTVADLANGKLQVVTHTVPGGGIGFGDFSLYRSGAGAARLNASLTADGGFIGSGASLTALNASNLGSGTVPDARLSANVAMRNAANTFSGDLGVAAAVARWFLTQNGVRTWSGEASGGNLNIGSNDNNGGVVFSTGISTTAGRDITCGGDLRLGLGGPKWVYDYAGNVILKQRSATVPATLADVIAVLQYHGLCS